MTDTSGTNETRQTWRWRAARAAFDILSALGPRRRRARPARPPTRIGVLLQWGIGDAVLALPLLRRLHEAYPGATVEVLGKPWLADLFGDEPYVHGFHVLVPPWTKFSGKYRVWDADWRTYADQLGALRRERFDLVIGIRLDPRENTHFRLLNTLETAGYAVAGGRLWIDRDLGMSAVAYRALHRSEVAAHAGKVLTGLDGSSGPRFEVADAAHGRWRAWLGERGYDHGLVVAVHGGAGHPIRSWGVENFTSVCRALPEAVGFVVVIDDGGVEGMDRVLPEAVPGAVWRGGLGDLKGLLSVCDVLLCCDSGIMHMGAASGCRVVAVFGPGSIRWFAPAGNGHEVVRIDPMPCRPCFDTCIRPSTLCMEGIDAAMVGAALDRVAAALVQERMKRGS